MSTDTSKATPRPWAIFDKGGPTLQIGLPKRPGTNPCVVHWTGFDSCDQTQVVQRANAALIVKAVNAHDEAVRLLRTAEEALCGKPSADVMGAMWSRDCRTFLASLNKENQ